MNAPASASVDATVAAALRYSRYAQRLVERHPALLEELRGALGTPWHGEAMSAALADAPVHDEAGLKSALRTLRRRVMLRLIVRDLAGLADLAEVMATVSGLAECALVFALDRLAAWQTEPYGRPVGEAGGQPQDMIVVAMGKLGGRELNVSSDIDLIFAYPEDGETSGPRRISNHEYFTLLGKKLIAALQETTADGFVFRVDMRLRPYGDSGPLVGSFAMLENYYLTQGREWERYAWIKGRPICGSQARELAAMLQPFVFRKYLDFGAFASMRELHAQIRREVLRRELDDNIKLGPGGIREVEFIAQVFQLVRGGGDAALQTRSTLRALELIAERGLMQPQAAGELREAYVFLRNLEHRLQYLEDAQTQTLPAEAGDRGLIAAAMGFAGWEGLLAALDGHRATVTRHFELVFAAPHSEQSCHPLSALWQGGLGASEAEAALAGLGYRDAAATWQRLAALRGGARYAHLPETSRARFDALLPPLIEVASRFPNPDRTLERILNLLEHIGRRAAYLALLLEYPQTLAQVARLCSASPWVSDYLAQHPVLLDELLDSRTLGTPPDGAKALADLRGQLAAAPGDTERQMDMLRHFKQAQVFRLVSQDLAGLLALEKLSDHLSDLADAILGETLRLCWTGLRGRHRDEPRFAIVGYGKLGGRELGYASDLDIIYLYDDDSEEAPENYARLGKRINAWLTGQTPAGLLYDTDLRLRPNGASGLLVSSVEAFRDYQSNRAWVWEHQALTRARFCAGDPEIGAAFAQIRCEVLTRQRDPDGLRQEILAMRRKMLEAHPNRSGLFDLKNDRGGIIDVEFAVQFLVLAYAYEHPDLTGNLGNLALLGLASERDLIDATLAEGARNAYRQFRLWQHALRLQSADSDRIEPTAAAAHVAAVQGLWRAIFLQD